MIDFVDGKYVVINVYGLTGYFDTYKEAIEFYRESIDNCQMEN